MARFSRQNIAPEQPREFMVDITAFAGLNIGVTSTQIDDNQSPDMLNLLPDDRGALDKRPGWKRQSQNLGTGMVNGMSEFRKAGDDTKYVVAWDTDLYTFDETTGTIDTPAIYSSLTDTKIHKDGFLNYKEKLWIINGNEYIYYDGTTVGTVESIAYIPTISVGTIPNGFDEGDTSTGIRSEYKNLLSPGFIQEFLGDGADVTYQLFYTNLDATTVTITVGGTPYTEGGGGATGFTVNRTTGVVTFNAAPGTDADVIITAYKTVSGDADKIKKCRFFATFGGANSVTVFAAGNPDFPNTDFRSDLLDPSFFPENGFDEIGQDNDPITGYGKQDDKLIIFKEKSIFERSFSINETTGNPTYSTNSINSFHGCIAEESILLIQNNPAFIDRRGVYWLTRENEISGRRRVDLLSDNINTNSNSISSVEGILDIGNLEEYIATEYNKQYWICKPDDGIVWVWDYEYSQVPEWFKLDNIEASCFLEINGELWFGSNTKGELYKFKLLTDADVHSDDDGTTETAIEARWRSKIFDFTLYTNLKKVKEVYVSLKPNVAGGFIIKTRHDRNTTFRTKRTISFGSMTYSTIVYSKFTYGGTIFPRKFRTRVKAKKIAYFQYELSNDETYENIGLLTTSVKFIKQRGVKK
jgi:hypothetical protein